MDNKSIIIIDTPENCDKCRICARAEFDDYCAYLGASNGEFIYPNGYAELAIGMSNCPLRPLPESHGKIGDIDRLYEVFKKNVAGASAFKELFDIAPTIIEADKGETDNE